MGHPSFEKFCKILICSQLTGSRNPGFQPARRQAGESVDNSEASPLPALKHPLANLWAPALELQVLPGSQVAYNHSSFLLKPKTHVAFSAKVAWPKLASIADDACVGRFWCRRNLQRDFLAH
jgi:hypothetical protein